MRSILIPTDLTFGIEALMDIGLAFSKKLDARLMLLYSIEPMGTMTATTPYVFHETGKNFYKQQKKDALERYTRLFDKYKNSVLDESYLELIIERGDKIANVIATAGKLKPEMILLPDEHEGLLEKILGETNNRIIQSVNVPVCIIPGERSGKGLTRVGCLIDYDEPHFLALAGVTDLVKNLKGKLTLLHPEGSDAFRSQLLFEGLKKETNEMVHGIHIEHIFYKSDDTIDHIASLIKDRQFDLIAIINEDESKLLRWFRQTTAEKLLDRLNVPLIVFPVQHEMHENQEIIN